MQNLLFEFVALMSTLHKIINIYQMILERKRVRICNI